LKVLFWKHDQKCSHGSKIFTTFVKYILLYLHIMRKNFKWITKLFKKLFTPCFGIIQSLSMKNQNQLNYHALDISNNPRYLILFWNAFENYWADFIKSKNITVEYHTDIKLINNSFCMINSVWKF